MVSNVSQTCKDQAYAWLYKHACRRCAFRRLTKSCNVCADFRPGALWVDTDGVPIQVIVFRVCQRGAFAITCTALCMPQNGWTHLGLKSDFLEAGKLGSLEETLTRLLSWLFAALGPA